MRFFMKFLIPTLAASALLSACGGSSSSSSGGGSAARPATPAGNSGSASELVKTASVPSLGGAVLVDAQGLTLYHLSGERAGKFICTSACLQTWHPLMAPAAGKPAGSVGSLGVVKRPDGSEQVTYKGMPLYTFAQDNAPGQANGQGIKDVGTWGAVTAGNSIAGTSNSKASASNGQASTPAAPSTPAPANGGGGSAYNY